MRRYVCPGCDGPLTEIAPDYDGAQCVPCGWRYTNAYLAARLYDKGVSPVEYAAEQAAAFAARTP